MPFCLRRSRATRGERSALVPLKIPCDYKSTVRVDWFTTPMACPSAAPTHMEAESGPASFQGKRGSRSPASVAPLSARLQRSALSRGGDDSKSRAQDVGHLVDAVYAALDALVDAIAEPDEGSTVDDDECESPAVSEFSGEDAE